jgi:hypothetical protein
MRSIFSDLPHSVGTLYALQRATKNVKEDKGR